MPALGRRKYDLKCLACYLIETMLRQIYRRIEKLYRESMQRHGLALLIYLFICFIAAKCLMIRFAF